MSFLLITTHHEIEPFVALSWNFAEEFVDCSDWERERDLINYTVLNNEAHN